MANVERVVLQSVTNPEIKRGLESDIIPTSAIYLRGDHVRISATLAANWDAGEITVEPAELKKPENKNIARKLAICATRNEEMREHQNIQRVDSPERAREKPALQPKVIDKKK